MIKIIQKVLTKFLKYAIIIGRKGVMTMATEIFHTWEEPKTPNRMLDAFNAIRGREKICLYSKLYQKLNDKGLKFSPEEMNRDKAKYCSEIYWNLLSECDTGERDIEEFYRIDFDELFYFISGLKDVEAECIDKINTWVQDFLDFADEQNGRPECDRTEKQCEEILLKIVSYIILLRKYYPFVSDGEEKKYFWKTWKLRGIDDEIIMGVMERAVNYVFGILCDLEHNLVPNETDGVLWQVESEFYDLRCVLSPMMENERAVINKAVFQLMYNVNCYWKEFIMQ